MKRSLKKSYSVALAGIGVSRFTFSPVRGTYMKPTPSRYLRVSICASTSATEGYFLGAVGAASPLPDLDSFSLAIMWDSRASARASESMRLAASGPPRLSRNAFLSISIAIENLQRPRNRGFCLINRLSKTVDPEADGVNLGWLQACLWAGSSTRRPLVLKVVRT